MIKIYFRQTVPMRDKEIEQDYRFMPEPNLPPLHLYDNSTIPLGIDKQQIVNIDVLHDELPPLPRVRRQILMKEYGLSPVHALLVNVRMCFPPIISQTKNK